LRGSRKEDMEPTTLGVERKIKEKRGRERGPDVKLKKNPRAK
jgi:hypothetical protein